MKEILIKYRWILFILLFFIMGMVLMWFFHPSVANLRKEVKTQKAIIQKQRLAHNADSVTLTRRDETINKIITFYEKKIKEKDKIIAEIPVKYIREKERIQKMPPIERVKYFGQRTKGAEFAVLDSMPTALVPIESIDAANNLFIERDELEETVCVQKQRLFYSDSLNAAKDSLIENKDIRIGKLTTDFYVYKSGLDETFKIIDKQKRIILRKNIGMGVSIGIGVLSLGAFIYSVAK